MPREVTHLLETIEGTPLQLALPHYQQRTAVIRLVVVAVVLGPQWLPPLPSYPPFARRKSKGRCHWTNRLI